MRSVIAPRLSSTSPSSEKLLSIRATASRAELMCWAICSWVMRMVSEPVRSASARRNSAANFENEVLRSDKPVLLDFYADWCGPCKMLSPVLHEIAEENAGALKVGKINVDEQMELAMRFQVSSIPMLVVFKDGKAVAKSVGYRPKSEIAAMVEGAR